MDLLKLKKVSIILFFAMFPSVIGAGMMTYQVRVSDAGGNYLDGPVTLGFRIYDSPSGNTVLWGETQDLTADQGIVDADLGKVNPLPEGLFENPELYLGITVQGDPEMAPRKRLVSTWKTISANRASGKRVQAGGCTLTVSGASEASADITFPQEFQSPPVVMLGAPSAAIEGKSFVPARVSDVTATGCVAHFAALDGSTATGSADFDWIAIGD